VNRITITGPGQQPVTVAPPFPVTAFNQTDTPGIYDVAQYSKGSGGQVRHGAFAVNLFDPLQSRLAPANLLPIAHSTAFDASGPGVPRVLREVWPWIAAFLLLVLCVEWWLFSRSYTLRSKSQAFRRGGGGADAGWGRLRRPGVRQGSVTSWPPTRWAGLSGIRFMAQTRYKATIKRIARARKRLNSNTGNRSKGKRNADV